MRRVLSTGILISGISFLYGCGTPDGPARYAPRERAIAAQDATTGGNSGGAVRQGNDAAGQSLNDTATPMPKGGMTVTPPSEPVGPTPGGGGSGSAGTGSAGNGSGGSGR